VSEFNFEIGGVIDFATLAFLC